MFSHHVRKTFTETRKWPGLSVSKLDPAVLLYWPHPVASDEKGPLQIFVTAIDEEGRNWKQAFDLQQDASFPGGPPGISQNRGQVETSEEQDQKPHGEHSPAFDRDDSGFEDEEDTAASPVSKKRNAVPSVQSRADENSVSGDPQRIPRLWNAN